MPRTAKEPYKPGFFRLEPVESFSTAGEAHRILNHVTDTDPFLQQARRPWASRRKSRKAEPPWKKFVHTFRLVEDMTYASSSRSETQTPPPQYLEDFLISPSSELGSAASSSDGKGLYGFIPVASGVDPREEGRPDEEPKFEQDASDLNLNDQLWTIARALLDN